MSRGGTKKGTALHGAADPKNAGADGNGTGLPGL